MNQMKKIMIFGVGMFIALTSLAVPQECKLLMEKVKKRLQGKGIQYYTLEWIDASERTTLRVVGRCNKSNYKLVYSQQHNKITKTETEEIKVSVVQKDTDAVTLSETNQKSPDPVLASNASAILIPPEATDNVQTLIQTLYSNSNGFANRIQEIIDRADTTMPLIKAYYAASNDATFRFNVILLLNQKIKSHRLGTQEMNATEQCLLDSLKDNSPFVRGEALWGLGQTRNKRWAPAVNALLNDPDAAVRSEAQITLSILR